MAPALSVPLIIVLGAAVVTASAELTRLAVLDVPQVLGGELWRLWSGHLAHLTWLQWSVDSLAFVLLWALYQKMRDDRAVLQLALGSALAVSLTVILMGRHTLYGGLSGLSSALLSAILLTALLREPRSIMPYLVSGILVGYLFDSAGVTDVPVAQEAHLAGALAGLSMALLHFMQRLSVVNQTEQGRMGAA